MKVGHTARTIQLMNVVDERATDVRFSGKH